MSGNGTIDSTERDFLVEGDVVEHIMNSDVFGVVVGHMGSLIGIRTSPTLSLLWFHEWELQPIGDDEYHGGSKEEVPAGGDNVIAFPGKLTKNTKTKGAA